MQAESTSKTYVLLVQNQKLVFCLPVLLTFQLPRLLKCLTECTSMPIILYKLQCRVLLTLLLLQFRMYALPVLACKQRVKTKSNALTQIKVTSRKQVMLETFICNFPAVQRFYSAAGSQRHLSFSKADLLDCPVILFLPLYFPSTA